MASREEEEFELVLGNKQLLSLFFLVVVLFGVFFSFGYTVGYGRGENSRTREVASAEPVEEPAQKVQLPETLLQSAPKPTEPTEAAKKEPAAAAATQQASPPTSPTRTTPAQVVPKPSPVEETKKSSAPPPPPPKTTAATKAVTPKTSTPAKAPPAAKSSPPPTTAAAGGNVQLQISAVRVKGDAEVYVQQLKAKGHPALLSDRGDGWYRVMVGPFNTDSDAKDYQKRLEQEGVDSLIRRQ
ncbi:MAG: SPOR domain-containing protein [Bryobacterales bacterium]